MTKALTVEPLQEYVSNRGATFTGIDRDKGVIPNVKILGIRSKNGRTYTREALKNAAALYEGSKVNVNHPKGSPLTSRDYQERLGSLSNVRDTDDGLYGDLRFNPKHGIAEQLIWDAEHSPENVGFSHNVEGRTKRQGDSVVVEAITSVISVDLVADPATTRSLFEHIEDKTVSKTIKAILESVPSTTKGYTILKEMEGDAGDVPVDVAAEDSADDQIAKAFEAAIIAVLKDSGLDLESKKTKIMALLNHQAEMNGEEPTEATEALKRENGDLKKRLDILEAQAAVAAKREKVTSEITEAKLPKELVSDVFLESLMDADDTKRTKLIKDRRQLVEATRARPLSRDQHLTESEVKDAKGFAKAVTS